MFSHPFSPYRIYKESEEIFECRMTTQLPADRNMWASHELEMYRALTVRRQNESGALAVASRTHYSVATLEEWLEKVTGVRAAERAVAETPGRSSHAAEEDADDEDDGGGVVALLGSQDEPPEIQNCYQMNRQSRANQTCVGMMRDKVVSN